MKFTKMSRGKILHIILIISFLSAAMASNANEVEQVLKDNEVIPDVISAAPKEFLKVTYNNNLSVDKGKELTPTQVQAEPLVEWEPEAGAYYTLIKTDPDAPSRAEPKYREVNHWIVGNIPGNEVAKGDVIHAYIGSGAPQGTGLHRYVFVLYQQPGKLEFDEARVGNNSRQDRLQFNTANFAKKYNLGDPVAVNFYQAQWDEYVPILQKQLSGN